MYMNVHRAGMIQLVLMYRFTLYHTIIILHLSQLA